MKRIILSLLVFPVLLFLFYVIWRYGAFQPDFSSLQDMGADTTPVLQTPRNLLSPIDPSLCPDNPEGYVYFTYGQEVFRYQKDSPIQVIAVIDEGTKPTAAATVLEGCKENPYKSVLLKYEFKEGQDPVGDIEFEMFTLSGVDHSKYGIASPGQDTRERYFHYVKKTERLCDKVADNLTRCVVASKDPKEPRERRPAQYMSDNTQYTTAVGRPFVMGCRQHMGFLFCDTYYRLYESVDVSYAIYPAKFDESKIIFFDQYIRQLIENMRVKVNR